MNLLCAQINSKTHQLKCLSSQIKSARETLANINPVKYSPTNIRRRDAYHRQQRKVLRDDNVSLGRRVCSSTQEVSNLSKAVNDISSEKKKVLVQKSKLKNKRDVKSKENTILKVAKRKLEAEYRTLRKKVDIEKLEIELQLNGNFTEDVRLCVMELLSYEIAVEKFHQLSRL